MQSLNPTQLQPPSSILKAEEKIPANQTLESRKLLQRTSRVDMNDPEQPLLGQELETIHTVEPTTTATNLNEQVTSESPVPFGVIPRGPKSPQVNSGWL